MLATDDCLETRGGDMGKNSKSSQIENILAGHGFQLELYNKHKVNCQTVQEGYPLFWENATNK